MINMEVWNYTQPLVKANTSALEGSTVLPQIFFVLSEAAVRGPETQSVASTARRCQMLRCLKGAVISGPDLGALEDPVCILACSHRKSVFCRGGRAIVLSLCLPLS